PPMGPDPNHRPVPLKCELSAALIPNSPSQLKPLSEWRESHRGGHMRLVIWAIGPVALSIASTASAQNIEIQSLIDRFDAARIQYDPVTVTKTLGSDYEEISPVGEVDDREKVLGFYAPEVKRAAPAMTSEPLVIRSRGELTIITTRKSFTIPGGPVRSVRVRYVAEREAGKWLLVSAQYTPMPPAKSD
ncbi:hypothetical protein, partial [Sphingomonas sp. T9W2]|uniref:hypothetical protein n=1 Tax=Sphingomonas sp. T9W2 TaxID=3143183 RepID=UPI0031F5621F